MDRVRRRELEDVKLSFSRLKWYEWLMASVMVLIALHAMLRAFISPSPGGNPPWLTAVNFVSAVAGVLCVFFCARAQVSNFVFGLINTLVYLVYLFYWHIWGTFALELFLYLPMGVIGWLHWARNRDKASPERTRARRLSLPANACVALGVTSFTVGFHALLLCLARLDQSFFPASVSWLDNGLVLWLDAATVAIGVTATLLQTLRYREQYCWWIITDIVTVALYIAHFDAVYLAKRSIYLIVAVLGLINWIRLSRQNGENA